MNQQRLGEMTMMAPNQSEAMDLEKLGQRLGALEQELAAARAHLATARGISGIRPRRRGWLAATITCGFVFVITVLPAWHASAQGPSPLDAQVRDLTRRVAELENKVESQSKDISDIALAVHNQSKDISDLVLMRHNQSKDLSDVALALQNQSEDISDLNALGESLGKAIQTLTSRVDAFEAQPAARIRAESTHIVKAPFTVVDAADKPIFQVLDANANTFRGAFVFNNSNKPVASLEANAQGVGGGQSLG